MRSRAGCPRSLVGSDCSVELELAYTKHTLLWRTARPSPILGRPVLLDRTRNDEEPPPKAGGSVVLSISGSTWRACGLWLEP
jgi:hypothetical protein